jgi:ADP-ribose pyrophosphatase
VSGERRIEALGEEVVYDGSQFQACEGRFRYADDGEEVQREFVRRVDAVAIVAYDEDCVWLVRQPREAIEQYTLEIPAGKIDPGESPLQTGKRELAEEIGRAAEHWTEVTTYYPSSGYTDEAVHVLAASGLRDAGVESDPAERIEIVRWPLADLDAAIAATNDAKTIIGLGWLRTTL